jgi:hypothetical protein
MDSGIEDLDARLRIALEEYKADLGSQILRLNTLNPRTRKQQQVWNKSMKYAQEGYKAVDAALALYDERRHPECALRDLGRADGGKGGPL